MPLQHKLTHRYIYIFFFKCQCLTLGSGGDSGVVADGSLYQGVAAGPFPGSSRGYKNTAGLLFVRAGALGDGGRVVKSRSIGPLVG